MKTTPTARAAVPRVPPARTLAATAALFATAALLATPKAHATEPPHAASEPTHTPAPPPAPAPKPAPAPSHVQPVGALRIVNAEGTTVLAQAPLSLGTTGLSTMTVDARQAFRVAEGRCAFNVKYDERSDVALFGTVNQVYDNDALVAQNSGIDLAPGVLRTVWTQMYLAPGRNNLRLVINAKSDHAVRAWVRVQVNGTCGATTTPAPPAPPASSPTHTPEPPKATTPPPPPAAPQVYQPGSTQWQALYNAWGYSNYGRTQLAGKGYAHYDDLVRVNADLGAVVKAGRVEAGTWASLMTRWNAIANDPAFQAAMKAIVPTGDRR
jgi:hypothetical protein